MPRRREIPKRDIKADPIYQSPLVSKFINCVMFDGKRSTAERIIYKSFDIIKDKTGDDPVKVFKKAIDNVKPSLEVKSRRDFSSRLCLKLSTAFLKTFSGSSPVLSLMMSKLL
jgi:small subunit ribosomal protein S7